jgi:hypothetical protein
MHVGHRVAKKGPARLQDIKGGNLILDEEVHGYRLTEAEFGCCDLVLALEVILTSRDSSSVKSQRL